VLVERKVRKVAGRLCVDVNRAVVNQTFFQGGCPGKDAGCSTGRAWRCKHIVVGGRVADAVDYRALLIRTSRLTGIYRARSCANRPFSGTHNRNVSLGIVMGLDVLIHVEVESQNTPHVGILDCLGYTPLLRSQE